MKKIRMEKLPTYEEDEDSDDGHEHYRETAVSHECSNAQNHSAPKKQPNPKPPVAMHAPQRKVNGTGKQKGLKVQATKAKMPTSIIHVEV